MKNHSEGTTRKAAKVRNSNAKRLAYCLAVPLALSAGCAQFDRKIAQSCVGQDRQLAMTAPYYDPSDLRESGHDCDYRRPAMRRNDENRELNIRSVERPREDDPVEVTAAEPPVDTPTEETAAPPQESDLVF